jgi:hypothetical protein
MVKISHFIKESKTKLLSAVILSQWLPGSLTSVQGGSLERIFRTGLNVAFGLAGIVAVAYLIYGGYMYITAGGQEGGGKAKNTILNAIIGLVIIIAAYAIANFIWTRFVGTGSNVGTGTI